MQRRRADAVRGRNFGRVRQRQQEIQVPEEESHEEATSPSASRALHTPSRRQISQSASSNHNYVWIRVDVVDAIWNNHGSLPRGWKPSSSEKRERSEENSNGPSRWDWMRAYLVQSSSKSRSPSPHRFRGRSNNRTVLATFTVDDPEFAPTHLRNATVSLSYDPSDTAQPLVCNANTWWNSSSNIHEPRPPDDLTVLTHLHEPSVVYCLQRRYEQDDIYTYTGNILLALNPFRILEGIYGEPVMKQYWQPNTLERPPPHVYAIAQDAYRNMLQSVGDPSPALTSNQSILVSGESGSGKTVTTKILMGYLATQSQRTMESRHNNKEGIESQILQSNPILESFGNARTVRNDNSSRFGKFMELLFTSSGTLVSASIETYLLEKVRLISQAEGERNYHVFYEILAGVPQRERQALRIANVTAQDFRMTAQSGTFDRRDGVEDRDTYQDLRKALDTVGFSKQEQRDILSVACALLYTSNLDFVETVTKGGGEGCELAQSPSLKSAIALLGVPLEALNNALCLCAIEARGETFHKNLTIGQATKALQALIKATYGALFAHIVQKVNESIAVQHSPHEPLNQLSRIGVLDIFGFESFYTNSFEQLCINYCNEALQQQFNRFVFKLEQEEYDKEGIEWSFIEFPDNQDILDLIEKRREGILSILNEQSRLATCTDASFCRAVHDKCKNHPRFSSSMTQRSNLTFTIQHYAGQVTYDSRNFIEKNKDELPKETTELLTSSSMPFLAYLGELLNDDSSDWQSSNFPTSPSPTSSVSSFSQRNGSSPAGKQIQRVPSSMRRESVGGQFSLQLRDLRQRIDATTPHYVRCLKPNDKLVPNQFDPHIIADQLRCAGVLEAIRVSRVGFPHRYFHDNFYQRYGLLSSKQPRSPRRIYPKERCEILIKGLELQVADALRREGDMDTREDLENNVSLGMQMGHTKVFLRRRVFEALEFLRNKQLGKSATAIQKNVRRFLAQLHYYDTFMAAITIQCMARRRAAQRVFTILREDHAAITIQKTFRKFLAETSLMAARLIAHFCQAYRRGVVARKLYAIMRVERQAMVIQKCWRRHTLESKLSKMRVSCIILQCFWRQNVSKRVLRNLRLQARDLGNVASERDHFREESLRLKREVELLRQSKTVPARTMYDEEVQSLRKEVQRLKRSQDTAPSSVYDEEVEQLRMEVERLQSALSRQNQILNPKANDQPPESVIVRKTSSWSLFGSRKDDASGLESAPKQGFSPSRRRHSRTNSEKNNYESPMHARKNFIDDNSLPWPSNGFSPGISSSSISLLDSEPIENGVNKGGTATRESIFRMEPTSEENSNSYLSRNAQSFSDKLVRLHQAVQAQDQRWISDIVSATEEVHVLVNEPGQDGRSALHLAVAANDIKTARYLIENGAVANVQDHSGETALHLSTSPPMTKMLLELGKANPNIPNVDGICALHLAVQRKDSGSVRVLMKHHAKVDIADNVRWLTPLHLVSMPDQSGHLEVYALEKARSIITDLLCAADTVDLDYQDSEGNTPLHYAVQISVGDGGYVINTLLEKGANPSIANSRQQEPLLLLCHNNDLRRADSYQECVHSMLFNGANPNQQSSTGCTPLHLSLYHKDIDSAVQLVNQGIRVASTLEKGKSSAGCWNWLFEGSHSLPQPKRWTAFWDEMGSHEVLALDMVTDEHSLHRILAAITAPPKLAPSRHWCMHCKSSLGSFSRALHCRHCGRHICSACSRCQLTPDFFPKSFEMFEASWVCVVCEKILVSRKEDNSNSTHPISSVDDDDDRYI